MKEFILSLVMCFCAAVVTNAANPPIQSYVYPQQKVYAYANGLTDQARCQAEADHMAANRISGHVWGVIGRFEGVGYGSSPNCKTCTPSGNMSLTGDASAQGANGKWYRVRSWR